MHSSEDILCNFVLHHTTNKTSASQYGLAVLYWGLHPVEPLGVPASILVNAGEPGWGGVWGNVHLWLGTFILLLREICAVEC